MNHALDSNQTQQDMLTLSLLQFAKKKCFQNVLDIVYTANF